MEIHKNSNTAAANKPYPTYFPITKSPTFSKDMFKSVIDELPKKSY